MNKGVCERCVKQKNNAMFSVSRGMTNYMSGRFDKGECPWYSEDFRVIFRVGMCPYRLEHMLLDKG